MYTIDCYRSSELTNMYNEELLALKQAIESISKSVGVEKEDELFYDNLIKQTHTQKEKDIIQRLEITK